MIDRLVEENLGLVRHVIKKYISSPRDMGAYSHEDLFQIGCIGLWKAAQSYDPTKSRFVTYACLLIRHELYDELGKLNRARKVTTLEDTGFLDAISLEEPDPAEWTLEEQIEQKVCNDQNRDIVWGTYGKAKEEASEFIQKGIQALERMADGETCGEIAAAMQAPVNHVTAWMAKARKYLRSKPELRQLLEEYR